MEIFQLNGMLNLVQVFMKKLAGGQKLSLESMLLRKGYKCRNQTFKNF